MKREPKWWKNCVVYQIYPRSFRDTNGDGIGDLAGIIEKLDYVKELGCSAIWICPFYASSDYDNGYDITDYQAIHPDFGTMKDAEQLIEEAHKRGIRLIIDMVLNHTSCEHPWFLESKKGREISPGVPNPYRDYYIWKEGKNGNPPNNWEAIFGGSAWTQCGEGEEHYLHIFSPMQPDLNWESPRLREELFRMMRWWLEKGVDGFRLDAVCYISKDPAFADSPDGNIRPCASFGPHFEAFARELNREVLSKYENIMTVAEMSESTPERAEIFANEDGSIFSMIFQFQHMDLDGGDSFKWTHRKIELPALKKLMAYWQTNLYGRAWNSLYWCNHDQPRIFSRFGDAKGPLREKSAKMSALCTHMMQGTPYVFQGEELGMTNYPFRGISEVRDLESLNAWEHFVGNGTFTEKEMLELISLRGRDNARTPMQWDDSPNAGFTAGKPWIPVNPDYLQINVKEQRARKNSVFRFYQKLIALRKEHEILTTGRYEPLDLEAPDTFAYLRISENEKLLVLCNYRNYEANVTLPESLWKELQTKTVKLLLTNEDDATAPTLAQTITLRPYEAAVLGIAQGE
ncbi:MAG: alpha-glucosidase [Planctomycetaceae bacterium]|nr:alpha-glucosidase [Planctomycetaceae bacterium]